MSKLTASIGELQRAQAAAALTQQVMVDGVDGAELLEPVVSLANFEGLDAGAVVKAMIRRSAYGLLRAMSVLPQPYTLAAADFSNNWTHLLSTYTTKLVCWRDGLGMKRIAGGVTRSSGSAVNGEVIATLPAEFTPLENGKVWMVATNTGCGRVDLIGRQLLWRTTGSFSTGYAYVFFDNVPGYR